MKFDIRQLDVTASTNDEAKNAAEGGAPEGTVVWALEQQAGRGRQGRVWSSPRGNLYCSILLRPEIPVREWGKYSFVVGLALYETVAFYLNKKIELKWPNDVLVEGRKISGILLESGENWLVAGMGLNVLHVPENPIYSVTSLAMETPHMPLLETVLTKLLDRLDHWYGCLNQTGFAPIRHAWLERARKGNLRVRQPQGDIEGQFADLDPDGNLCLILKDGTQKTFSTGDVFF